MSTHAVNTLEKIATTLGVKGLNLRNGDPCTLGTLTMAHGVSIVPNSERNNTIRCDCSFYNNNTCHITSM